MTEIFIYPVSAIMKFWHLIIHHFMNDSAAWIVSIVLLVLTVRSFIAPLTWLSIKSGRIGALMRPEGDRLRQQRQKAETVEEIATIMLQERELQEQHGYSVSAGCIPPLIMFPFFIGLYQTVLRMARINDLDHVGLLNEKDIVNFREARINGVSITDFAKDHITLVSPVLIAAICFTVLALCISTYRGYLTTHFDHNLHRWLFWLFLSFIPAMPPILWFTAVNGPIPLAVIVYWGCTYLYTLVQTIIIEYLLYRTLPLTAEVHQQRREGIATWRRRRTRAGKAELRAEKAAAKSQKAALKQTEKSYRDLPADDRPLTRSAMHNRARKLVDAEMKARKAAAQKP